MENDLFGLRSSRDGPMCCLGLIRSPALDVVSRKLQRERIAGQPTSVAVLMLQGSSPSAATRDAHFSQFL